MRIKLDEDLSPLVGEPFRAAGHGVQSVVGQGWGGLNDADLWSRVCSAQKYFVTADKGFGDVRTYPPGTHAGILLLRPDRDSILRLRALVERTLTNHALESLAGCLTVATPRGIRIRRPSR
jgi:hypothetical protein